MYNSREVGISAQKCSWLGYRHGQHPLSLFPKLKGNISSLTLDFQLQLPKKCASAHPKASTLTHGNSPGSKIKHQAEHSQQKNPALFQPGEQFSKRSCQLCPSSHKTANYSANPKKAGAGKEGGNEERKSRFQVSSSPK